MKNLSGEISLLSLPLIKLQCKLKAVMLSINTNNWIKNSHKAVGEFSHWKQSDTERFFVNNKWTEADRRKKYKIHRSLPQSSWFLFLVAQQSKNRRLVGLFKFVFSCFVLRPSMLLCNHDWQAQPREKTSLNRCNFETRVKVALFMVRFYNKPYECIGRRRKKWWTHRK